MENRKWRNFPKGKKEPKATNKQHPIEMMGVNNDQGGWENWMPSPINAQ